MVPVDVNENLKPEEHLMSFTVHLSLPDFSASNTAKWSIGQNLRHGLWKHS